MIVITSNINSQTASQQTSDMAVWSAQNSATLETKTVYLKEVEEDDITGVQTDVMLNTAPTKRYSVTVDNINKYEDFKKQFGANQTSSRANKGTGASKKDSEKAKFFEMLDKGQSMTNKAFAEAVGSVNTIGVWKEKWTENKAGAQPTA
jgi:hypothetical protein